MNTCSLQYLFLLYLLLQGHHSNLGSHPVHKKKWNSSSSGPLYQNEGKCSAFDMEMIFHSHANKPHFQKKGCVLGLILKVRVYELGGGLLTSMCSAHKHITELKKNWPQKSWKNRENAIKSWIMPSYLYLKKFPHDQQNFPCILVRLCVLYTSLHNQKVTKKNEIAKLSKIVIHSMQCYGNEAKKNFVLYLYDSNSWLRKEEVEHIMNNCHVFNHLGAYTFLVVLEWEQMGGSEGL